MLRPARALVELLFSVTVSPAEPHQQGRLLNYLTAPNVFLSRGVLASCAVPGVFPPEALPVETRRAIVAGIRAHQVKISHKTKILKSPSEDDEI